MNIRDGFAGFDRRRFLVFAALFAVAAAVFVFLLELRAPYYFLQDDNRDITLPAFVHGWRALSVHGEIARYNFHQFLGTPTLFISYPPAMLSVWLSQKLLGHWWGAVDVLASLCVYVSGLGFFLFCGGLGLGFWAAAFGAAAWALCPFVILTQASWWILGPAAACFPFMMYGMLRIYAKADRAGAAVFAASLGMLLLMTHPQYGVSGFAVAFLFLAVCVISEEAGPRGFGDLPRWLARAVPAAAHRNWRALMLAAVAAAAGLLIAGPQIAIMREVIAASADRSKPMEYTWFSQYNFPPLKWLLGLVWPYHAMPAGLADLSQLDKLAHLGYVPLALAAAAGAAAWRNWRRDCKRVWTGQFVMLAFAVFSLLWAFGVFNWYEYYIPPLNRFRWHFKMLFFADFFILALAAYGFQMIGGRRWLLALHLLNMALFYFLGPRALFKCHSDAIPAVEPRANMLAQGRIVSLGWQRSGNDTTASLGFDYATLFGLFHVSGYRMLTPPFRIMQFTGLHSDEDFLSRLEDRQIRRLRVWGARWYVVCAGQMRRYAGILERNGIKEAARDGSRVIFEDKRAFPMLFRENSSVPAGELEFAANTVTARLNEGGGCVVVNTIYDPGFSALSGGRPAKVLMRVTGQTLVCLPGQEKEFVLRYSSPSLEYGLWACALGALVLAALVIP
ncbi:MAG: hypothetical protein WC421_05830 [Elusimicrobiales bacterium]